MKTGVPPPLRMAALFQPSPFLTPENVGVDCGPLPNGTRPASVVSRLLVVPLAVAAGVHRVEIHSPQVALLPRVSMWTKVR